MAPSATHAAARTLQTGVRSCELTPTGGFAVAFGAAGAGDRRHLLKHAVLRHSPAVEAPHLDTMWIDESGNTGANLLDNEQPVLVHAGIITGPHHEPELLAIVRALLDTHSPGALELKSGILARPRARRAVAEVVVHELPRLGVPIVVAIVDKAFAIVSFILDTCLDPEWNPRASVARWGSPTGRRLVAAVLHETLPRAVIAQFADAFRRLGVEDAVEAVRRIASLLELADRLELAHEIRGCLPALPAQLRAMSVAMPTTGPVRTTVTSFMAVCNMAEEWLRRERRTCRVVHDESLDTSTYQSFLDAWRNRPVTRTVLEDRAVLYTGFERFVSFAPARSHEHPGLQLADLVAGAFRRVATSVARQEPIDAELTSIGALPTAPSDLQRVHTMASDEFIRQMHRGPR